MPNPQTSAAHRVEHMPLDDVAAADRNPKAHATKLIEKSINRFGLAELPLLDDRTGKLVAGHGRINQLRSMRDAGATPPAGVTVDADGHWLVPVVRGWSSRSDDEAEAYLVASNQLTTKGGWDDHALAEMLSDLHDAQLLELTGFDTKDLEALEKTLRGDPDPIYGDAGTDDLGDVKRTVVIECSGEREQQDVLEACLGNGWDAVAVTR